MQLKIYLYDATISNASPEDHRDDFPPNVHPVEAQTHTMLVKISC